MDCDCKYHKHEFVYLCRCKKIWADTQEARNHMMSCEHVKVNSKMYDHNDCPQGFARKIVMGNIDLYC
jgi:hypothetical protein